MKYSLANTSAPMAVANYIAQPVDPAALHMPVLADFEAILATPVTGFDGATLADALPDTDGET
ncbi:MAG: hypothetical protein M3Y06_08825 [Actinomycetota bacterium]|nr:hypothetical protein [Actinomycetota bacterium]